MTKRNHHDSPAHRFMDRYAVLRLAELTGNIRKACNLMNIDRTSFYRWKKRYEEEGISGLLDYNGNEKNRTNRLSDQIIQLIIDCVRLHPSWGCKKISQYLHYQHQSVSPPTVQKILTQMGLSSKSDRLLQITNELISDPYVEDLGDNSTIKSSYHKHMLLWERIKDNINKDILNNVFGKSGILPSHKELQARYNVNYRTLNKALSALCKEGTLTQTGRSYSCTHHPLPSTSTRITFICYCDRETRRISGIFNREILRTLESRCAEQNIKLDIVKYYLEDDLPVYVDMTRQDVLDLLYHNDTIGCLYPITYLETGEDDILELLTHFKKPIAILDEVGGWQVPRLLEKRRNVRLFSLSSGTGPGQTVARFLLETGHRSIAYFSPFHSAAWSQQRLKGIMDTFEKSGFDNIITPYTLDEQDYPVLGAHHSNYANLMDLYDSWKKEVPLKISDQIDILLNLNVGPYMMSALMNGEISIQMEGLFKKAIEEKKSTAWVMANDRTAHIGLAYLKSKGIRVPSDISVISFDNSIEASETGLTSYSFGVQNIVSTMIQHVLGWPIPREYRTQRVIQIKGTVVKRNTIAMRN